MRIFTEYDNSVYFNGIIVDQKYDLIITDTETPESEFTFPVIFTENFISDSAIDDTPTTLQGISEFKVEEAAFLVLDQEHTQILGHVLQILI